MLALSDFWLLHGFKESKVLKDTLTSVKELAFLDTVFDKGGYEAVYTLVMEMDQAKVNMHLRTLLARIVPAYQQGTLKKEHADFWAARAALTFNVGENIDRGIFSVYLLNLLNMQPGEAIFQDAGILHAYLEGQNVEIMANSDNVLRGGLTPKHIDVYELVKHVTFAPVIPVIIEGESISAAERIFETPAPDFELSSITLSAGQNVKIEARTTEIFILLEGTAEVANDEKKISLKRGEAFAAFAGTQLDIKGRQRNFIQSFSAGRYRLIILRLQSCFCLIFAQYLHIMKINKSIVVSLVLLIIVAALYRVIPNRPMGLCSAYCNGFVWRFRNKR
jgi:mannose-6-phosphate isomerase